VYPAPLVRPAGDIDLVVSHENFCWAKEILTKANATPITVGIDLKLPGIWEEMPNEDFWGRTEQIDVNDVLVTVLGLEDQLRMLCFHLLKHGATRPVWLGDIASTLESLPGSTDWERCLGSNSLRQNWIVTTLGLSNRILGANLGGLPEVVRIAQVLIWMERAMLKQWGLAAPIKYPVRVELRGSVRNVVPTLLRRWPSPILATIRVRSSFNDVPRLPFQIAAFLMRLVSYALLELPEKIFKHGQYKDD